MKIVSVNSHTLRACDARCWFCSGTLRDDLDRRSIDDDERVIWLARDAEAEKLNLAEGKPTLHPDVGGLVRFARSVSRFGGCSGRVGTEEP
jgi:MoaA/NifB/PqqE/SkfB family radical SAM enzyme